MTKLKKKTILELGKILKEEFNSEFPSQDLETFANSLVGYFDLLIKIDQTKEVRESSTQPY